MSKVKIQGNASGTGVVTLTAPNTNTDRTITLPDGDISLGVGIDDNATSTAITIDANKNVTVGMGSAGIMEVRHSGGYGGLRIAGGAGGSAAMLLLSNNYSATVEDKWSINLDGYTDDLTFFSGGTPAVGTERVRFLDSGGISFNGDTAAANALDDYEEGTWTPTPAQGITGGLTINSARYTKIGRTVTWSMYISTFNGNTSSLRIGGLPFTNQGSSGYSMQSNINSSSSNATITNPHFRIPPSSSVLYALKNNDSLIIGTELDSTHIIASGTYQTN
jgi:hypothetical protein